MKNTIIRIAIYIPIISFFWWIFTPGFFAPQNFPGPPVAQAISYLAFYGVTYGVWIVAYEACYRLARYVWKPKSAPVPETQRLEPQETRPTTGLGVNQR